MESTIFDFPHPFGPRSEVIPSAKSICVLSAKLLKPTISRHFKNKFKALLDYLSR